MRRFLGVWLVLLCAAVPFGAAVVGCGSKTASVQYCNGQNFGPKLGEVASITLDAGGFAYGESLNYGQIGPPLSATAVDCKGTSVSVRSFTYGTSDMSLADINPSNGAVCGGTWNRNSGAGIPDYTTCTAPANAGPSRFSAVVTATAEGATSNQLTVYIHPVVTSVVIGSPSVSCTNQNGTLTADPSSNCCPAYTTPSVTAPPYTGGSCLSQNASGQLYSRVYANGTTNPADNITCQAGHVGYLAANSSVVNIDATGVATALQPGSTIVTGTVSNSTSGGSLAGFFATCPPASIALKAPTTNPTNVTIGTNNLVPLVATVTDTNGVALTGVNLTYVSTDPTTTPASGNQITPLFPASATITAECLPPGCNPAPFGQIGLFGNGQPLSSNGVQITSTGRSAAQVFAASTNSQYLYSFDFSTTGTGSLLRLPYVPNSMVITTDGSTIFMGTSHGLLSISTAALAIANNGNPYATVPGTVLTVSPDGSTVVVTDPLRNTVSLVSNTGAVTSTYGGNGTHAEFSPDNQTVYITAGNQLLVHSQFTGWTTVPLSTVYNDVAITEPSVGAFFAGPAITEARSICASSTSVAAGTPPLVTNSLYPVVNDTTVATDRLAATNDGLHIVGATSVATGNKLTDIAVTLATQTASGLQTPAACPTAPTPVPPGFISTSVTSQVFAGVTPTTITGVIPATNSKAVFVTYAGAGGQLPLYVPSTTGVGTLSYVKLSGTAAAPLSGTFATDNNTFYTGTSGDNLLHLITLNGSTWSDSSTLTPALPVVTGTGYATPDLIAERARRVTN